MSLPKESNRPHAQYSLVRYVILFVVLFATVTMGVLWLPLSSPPPQRTTQLSSALSRPKLADIPLKLAGSGSNLPLTRLLVQAFLAKHQLPSRHIQLFNSIGSTGGIHAVTEGAIQLGLLSRSLKPVERNKALQMYPYAKVAVVLAAHRSVPARIITEKGLYELYAGQQRLWSNGNQVVVLQRERGDSSHRSVARTFRQFQAINQRAYKARRWRVLYRDQGMQRALLETPGSVGLLDFGLIQLQKLPLRVLAFKNHHPTLKSLQQGTYPFTKTLRFVSHGPAQGLARKFLRFVYTPQGQGLIRNNGYLPLPAGGQ